MNDNNQNPSTNQEILVSPDELYWAVRYYWDYADPISYLHTQVNTLFQQCKEGDMLKISIVKEDENRNV